MLSPSPRNPRRFLSRGLILTVIAAAALVAVGTPLALGYVLDMFGPLGHPWQFHAQAAALHPAPYDAAAAEAWFAPGSTHTTVGDIGVATFADLPGPRAKAAWATSWPFIVVTATSVTVIALGVSLLRDRPFRRVGASALALLAALDLVGCVLAPWLDVTAKNEAIAALGLTGRAAATESARGELTVTPGVFAWPFIDWTMLAFGVVCGLAAWLLWRAHGLQRDTDGLV